MMRVLRASVFHGVRFKLMIVYLLLILFAMQLIGAYFIQSLNRYFMDDFAKNVSHEAMLLANVFSASMAASPPQAVQIRQFVQPFSELAGSTVYVLDKDGIVMGTSANQFLVGQKRMDTEVNRALLGLETEQIAVDVTGARNLYLAVPMWSKGQVVGVVEFVAPMRGVYLSISRIIIIFATGTLIALGLTAILAIIIARTITGPITAVTRTARALAAGDFDQTVAIHSNDEIGELAATFNMLAGRLRQAIANTESEKRRLQAVMSTMKDGVIATNASQEIVLMNPAASKLLSCERSLIGRHLSAALPGSFAPGDAQLVAVGDKIIAVSVTALGKEASSRKTGPRQGRHKAGGRVFVMRDVTEETRLEEARRRFVADVSHELRTPITTVKSYVEALLEGAHEEPEVALRFLKVMDRETNRMTRLIRDLLQLSRFDGGFETLHKELARLKDLINATAERFALVAFQSDVQFVTEVVEDAFVYVDRDRMDQAIDNILSNSLKYTPAHGVITVRASVDRTRGRAVLTVQDTGSGIPEEELPHIFERFYRVDKARSRHLGGTGLGLAIAKDIVKAHEGEINATSRVGKGTTIRIFLPLFDSEENE